MQAEERPGGTAAGARRRRSGMRDEDRSWLAAAVPGEGIETQLAALEPAWAVVRGVDLGDRRTPLAHVVAGAGGLFTVHVAEHPHARVWVRGDGFLVDGLWVDHLREARRAAVRLDRVIATALGRGVAVRPVVALVTDPAAVAIKRQPDDVHVAAPGTLGAWLAARPPVLDAGTVARVELLLRRAATLQLRAG